MPDATAHQPPPRHSACSAVIFDLDGTLTVPALDFDAIRAEIGIARGPILEAIETMDSADRDRADRILARHEQRAAEHSVLHEGAIEVVDTLRRGGYPVAILTRNARRWVNVVLGKHGLCVDAMRTREDGAVKPSAEPVLRLCDELGADPGLSWMIGDYLFDIQSGRQAGTRTVLMIADDAVPEFAYLADHVIRTLRELLPIIDGTPRVPHR